MASQVCIVCGERVTGNMQVHLMSKCQGGDRHSEDEGSSSLPSPPPSLSSSKTVNVRFLFKPLTNLSFKTVTLLSSFSIDLISNGMTYTSDYTQLPVGDYDGQLIIGSNVCYAVKKFVVDTSGETIPLELDLRQMDTDEKSSGSYSNEGTTPVTDQTISMTYNPSYTATVCTNPYCRRHGKARGYTDTYSVYGGDSYGNGVYDDGSYGDEVYEGEGGQRKVVVLYYKYGEGEEGMYSPTTADYQTATPTNYKYAPPTGYKAPPGKQRVTSNSPPTSDSETTPTEFAGETEGVSPVKRKTRSQSPPPLSHSPPPPLSPATSPPPSPPPPPPPTSSKPQSSSVNKSKAPPTSPPPNINNTPSVREVPGLSANKTSSTGYASSTPTHSNEPTTGFHVADIKSTGDDVSAIKEENKRLKDNMERTKALWDGQRRRLEQRLAQLEGRGGAKSTGLSVVSTGDDERVNELEGLVEELRAKLEEKEVEIKDKERELTEAKDRITALENQMVEYASIMKDQSKTLQSTHHYSQHSQDLYSKAMEFTKKQQIEYQEKITSLEKDIEKIRTLSTDSSVKLEVMEKLKAEIDDYRSQMKTFLKEMESKDKLIQSLQDRLSGKPDPKFGELEIVTLQEKCDAWRERADSLGSEMDELKSLLDQLSRDKLAAEEQLEHHLKSQSSDATSRHTKLDDSLRQVKELQSLRLKMENTIHSLKAEKAELSQRNAELVESCDPEKYAKLKKEVLSMSKKLKEKDSEISKLTDSLQFHTEGNRELKEHLDAALNEETIAKIEQRISKYKTERDTTKEAMKTLKASCDEQLSQKELTILSLREELLKYQEEKQSWAVKYKKRKSELSDLRKGSKETIARLQSQLQEKEELLQSLVAPDRDDDDDDDEGGISDISQEEYASNGEEIEEDNELYLTAISDSLQSITSAQTTRHSTDNAHKTSPSLSRHTRSSVHKNNKEAIPCHTHLRGASKGSTSTSSQVIVRTKTGEKQLVIGSCELEEMSIGRVVVVKRKDGIYEQGLLRYVGKEQCGVELELSREGTNGKSYDGTYKDGQRYFHCRKGHGLYTLPSNVFKIIS